MDDSDGRKQTQEDTKRIEEAENLFKRSIKADPNNVTHLLWYAKLLKSIRRFPQVFFYF
jgi:hypothetical protein